MYYKKFGTEYSKYIDFVDSTMPLKLINKLDTSKKHKHNYMFQPFSENMQNQIYKGDNLIKIHSFGLIEEIQEFIEELLPEYNDLSNSLDSMLMDSPVKLTHATAQTKIDEKDRTRTHQKEINTCKKVSEKLIDNIGFRNFFELQNINFQTGASKKLNVNKLIAEAGDVWWYICAITITAKINPDFLILDDVKFFKIPGDQISWITISNLLLKNGSLIASILKRASTQTKPLKYIQKLETDNPDNPKKSLKKILAKISKILQIICLNHGFSLSEILENNKAKILKRFPKLQ